MKKNLAKKVTLSILAGAMLMSNSVAWAEGEGVYTNDSYEGSLSVGLGPGSVLGNNSTAVGVAAGIGSTTSQANNAVAVGYNASIGNSSSYSVAVGANTGITGARSVAVGDTSRVNGYNAVAVGAESSVTNGGSVAVGKSASVSAQDGVALGYKVQVIMSNSVALGYGSVASTSNVVSVGDGGIENGEGPDTRSIINVTDVSKESNGSYLTNAGTYGSYAVNVNTLVDALSGYVKKETTNGTTTTKVSSTFTVEETGSVGSESTTVTINGNDTDNPIVMDNDGITVGTNSTRMDGTGFYVWADNNNSNVNANHNIQDAIAFINDEGEIKAANGAFNVDESGNVTANGLAIKDVNGTSRDIKDIFAAKATTLAGYGITDAYTKTETNTELAKKADKATTLEGYGITDAYTKTEIDEKLGGSNASVAGLNQRLDKTNAKINKVGAGAAALAALHPLEYDPDDKLTFSAGMGNYAGENAAALGAFYRPNEKFMLSLGGTMGNGENMVNLGLSIGLDKPNGYAKLSKRELIQEVNAVKAENAAMKDQLANADERIAKLEALVAQLVNK